MPWWITALVPMKQCEPMCAPPMDTPPESRLLVITRGLKYVWSPMLATAGHDGVVTQGHVVANDGLCQSC